MEALCESEGDCILEEVEILSYSLVRDDGVKGGAELPDEEEDEGEVKERGGGVVDSVGEEMYE